MNPERTGEPSNSRMNATVRPVTPLAAD